jgi:Peptidase family M23
VSDAVAPVRMGSRFHPLPGPLPVASGPSIAAAAPSSAPGLVLLAPAGTPVHAVEAGTVDRSGSAGHPLRVVADSGLTFCYDGVAPGSVTVSSGTRVAAGTILGTVAVTSLSTAPPERPRLVLRILDAAGADIDVAAFLVGLPDPNELGHAAVGTGTDIDPDAVDREIVLAAGSASPVRDGTP